MDVLKCKQGLLPMGANQSEEDIESNFRGGGKETCRMETFIFIQGR